MIEIQKTFLDEVLEHLDAAYPNEGCGLLGGEKEQVAGVYPIQNEEASEASYRMDSQDQLKAMREMRQRGQELVGIYHSHPTSEAFPSETDVALAAYEEVFYLIVSLKDRANPQARAFWIQAGEIKEDKLCPTR